MFIDRNSEGVHAYLLKCFRGTCSSVGMLKGYVVRERLGTPGLALFYQKIHCFNNFVAVISHVWIASSCSFSYLLFDLGVKQ